MNYRDRVVEFEVDGKYVAGTVVKQSLRQVCVRLAGRVPVGTMSLQEAWIPIGDLTRIV